MEGIVDITPEKAGFRPDVLEILNSHLDHYLRNGVLIGAGYLLSRRGKIFAHKTLGKLRKGGDSPDLSPDSIRNMFSIAKVFTATAILQLIEKGKLYLNQPVMTIIPEFDTDLHKTISIFHLLTHTHGLRPVGGYFMEPYPSAHDEGMEDSGWIRSILTGPLTTRTGREYSYGSHGFCILGEIVKRLSGMEFDEYVSRHIFRPLGMENTFYQVPEDRLQNVCYIHDFEKEWLASPLHRRGAPPAASNLYSTMADVWKFGQMMLNKGIFNGNRILSRKSVEAMSRNQLKNVPAFHWGQQIESFAQGFGWALTADATLASPGTFHHEGWGRSALYIDPAEEMVVFYMTMDLGPWTPETIVNPRNIIWSGLV